MHRHLLGILLLAGAALSGCQTGPETSRPMTLGSVALPPRGFVDFCARNVEACDEVAALSASAPLTADRWTQLEQVNDQVNRGFAYVSDQRRVGSKEHWSYPTDAGDCEDLALEKRRRLVEMGWPSDRLLIALASVPRVGGHAVLVAVTDQGDYVLDVREPSVRSWDQVDYRWLRRQSRENPRLWVNLAQRP